MVGNTPSPQRGLSVTSELGWSRCVTCTKRCGSYQPWHSSGPAATQSRTLQGLSTQRRGVCCTFAIQRDETCCLPSGHTSFGGAETTLSEVAEASDSDSFRLAFRYWILGNAWKASQTHNVADLPLCSRWVQLRVPGPASSAVGTVSVRSRRGTGCLRRVQGNCSSPATTPTPYEECVLSARTKPRGGQVLTKSLRAAARFSGQEMTQDSIEGGTVLCRITAASLGVPPTSSPRGRCIESRDGKNGGKEETRLFPGDLTTISSALSSVVAGSRKSTDLGGRCLQKESG